MEEFVSITFLRKQISLLVSKNPEFSETLFKILGFFSKS